MDSISYDASRVVYHHLPSCTSTMDVAHQMMAQADPLKLYVISTDYQTKGRGRFGREWRSGTGNLMMTICFFGPDKAHASGLMEFAALLNMCVKQYVRTYLKWPNDVYGSKGKLGGVIMEKSDDWNVVGCGVNILTEPGLPNTSSLYEETGQVCCHALTLKESVAAQVQKWLRYPEFSKVLHNEWYQDVLYLNQTVRITCPVKGTQEGTFVGVNTLGQALLVQRSGTHAYSLGQMRPGHL